MKASARKWLLADEREGTRSLYTCYSITILDFRNVSYCIQLNPKGYSTGKEQPWRASANMRTAGELSSSRSNTKEELNQFTAYENQTRISRTGMLSCVFKTYMQIVLVPWSSTAYTNKAGLSAAFRRTGSDACSRRTHSVKTNLDLRENCTGDVVSRHDAMVCLFRGHLPKLTPRKPRFTAQPASQRHRGACSRCCGHQPPALFTSHVLTTRRYM